MWREGLGGVEAQGGEQQQQQQRQSVNVRACPCLDAERVGRRAVRSAEVHGGPSNVINVPLIHGARLRVVLLWLLLEWRSSGVAELLKLLHILSGVNAGWQRTARTRSSSAKPSGLACAAAAPVAVAAAAAAAAAEEWLPM